MDNITIVTYSQSPRLVEFSHALLDTAYPKLIFNTWSPAYIQDLMYVQSDWIIHIDEDAFVFRSESIPEIIAFMEKNGYAACGVPDGGIIDHRPHNPVSCNPFFTILHRKRILDRVDKRESYTSEWSPEFAFKIPNICTKKQFSYEFDNFEPYYGFYFWLLKHGFEILYLNAEQWKDEPEGISTILNDHNEYPFVLHTWYSREYQKIRYSKHRIMRILYRLITGQPGPIVAGVHFKRISRAMKASLIMKSEISCLKRGITNTLLQTIIY